MIHTLNPRLHPDDLSYIAADAGDRVIVVDESLYGLLDSVNWEFQHVIVVSHSGSVHGASIDYESLIASSEPIRGRRSTSVEPRPCATRRAPPVAQRGSSTRTERWSCIRSSRLSPTSSASAPRRDPGRGTMSHVNAWGLPYTAALTGAALVLPGPRLDPESLLELLASERVTFTAGVPTIWMSVLGALDAEPDRWDLSALATVDLGGAAVSSSLIRGFDRHGLRIIQGWGMTETSPLGTVCRLPRELDTASPAEQYDYRARQGVAIPLVEVRARGEDGELVPWDDRMMGELEVRGPWVAAGYHGGVGADNFTGDGWFRTGDIVRIDHCGCIRICDRSKDLVKSGGEWISSVDLENQLMAHHAVAEAAVIGIPDDRWGERPLAAVVLRDGVQASPEELRVHLSGEFAKWQLPERIEFITAIPRTATGKFKKTELREKFAA